MDEQPRLPQNLNYDDRQRVEQLHERFRRAQKHIDELQHRSGVDADMPPVIEHVDVLIRRLRNIEEQIRINTMQPLNDYERLIPDCQVGFLRTQWHLHRRIKFVIRTSFPSRHCAIFSFSPRPRRDNEEVRMFLETRRTTPTFAGADRSVFVREHHHHQQTFCCDIDRPCAWSVVYH